MSAAAGRVPVRGAAAVVVVALALAAAWGVPIDPGRVTTLVAPAPELRVTAKRARIALRPWPTVAAADVRLGLDDRVEAELAAVDIRLTVRRPLAGRPAWSRARVRRGAVVVRPTPDAPLIRCADLRGTVHPLPNDGVRFDLGGECDRERLVLVGARYRGVVAWRGRGPVRSSGRLHAGSVRFGGLAGEQLSATVRTGPDGLRVTDGTVALGDGTLRGRGRWCAAGGRRRGALAFSGAGAAAEVALADAPVRIGGRWQVWGRGRAVSTDRRPLVAASAGRGRAVFLGGQVEPLDVGGALLDGFEVWRGRRRRRLIDEFPDLFGGRGLHYDRFVVVVRARRGHFDLAPVRIRSRSYAATGQGRIGRDGSVRGTLDLRPSEALADALLGRGTLRAIVAGDGDDVVVPVEVTGRVGDLRVRPAPEFARGVLERALGGSALGRALDRLFER